MSKTIVKSLPIEKTHLNIPKSEVLHINHLCIGMTTDVSSYMSDGNTRHSTNKYYDFGYGVHNSASFYMRVSFTLESIGKDEYATKKYYAWKDIAPGEKTRVWANFRHGSTSFLNHWKITEIGIGKTPQNRNESATWSNFTNPNRRIGQILNVDSIRKNKTIRVLLIILIILICLCLIPYLGYYFFVERPASNYINFG